MASSKKKLSAKVDSLSASLDGLETALDPLVSQTLPETLLSLDNLQQAKLQTLLPYLINSLIFIYLKTRGMDPKTHEVVAELNRVKAYFEKIKEAEDPAKRRSEIDKAAASRFIKHAITQAKQRDASASDLHQASLADCVEEASGSKSTVPIRITSKMLERQQYEKELREAGDDTDEGVLDIFNDGDQDGELDQGAVATSSIEGKGKRKAADTTDISVDSGAATAGSRRRKRPMDPFGDFGRDLDATDFSGNEKTQRRQNAAAVLRREATPQSPHPSSTPNSDDGVTDKPKRRRKRAKAAGTKMVE
ncbi:C1D-domain-containing protein [Rickenella mellea]|uniref:Exosome complex protein n=1 Tax=Rickenella mellea TaxID=50990 RepID=A0A4Y7QMS9_9AGAM|nr:C1D-domain-containing protein [Rickenella mellea]